MSTDPTGLVTGASVREAGGGAASRGASRPAGGAEDPRSPAQPRTAPRSPAQPRIAPGEANSVPGPLQPRGASPPAGSRSALSRDAGGFPAGFSAKPPPLRFRLCPLRQRRRERAPEGPRRRAGGAASPRRAGCGEGV